VTNSDALFNNIDFYVFGFGKLIVNVVEIYFLKLQELFFIYLYETFTIIVYLFISKLYWLTRSKMLPASYLHLLFRISYSTDTSNSTDTIKHDNFD